MKNAKTTILSVLTAVVTLAGAAIAYLKTGTLDGQSIMTGVLGLLAALGFYHAADGGA